jgi:hypothetical protein
MMYRVAIAAFFALALSFALVGQAQAGSPFAGAYEVDLSGQGEAVRGVMLVGQDGNIQGIVQDNSNPDMGYECSGSVNDQGQVSLQIPNLFAGIVFTFLLAQGEFFNPSLDVTLPGGGLAPFFISATIVNMFRGFPAANATFAIAAVVGYYFAALSSDPNTKAMFAIFADGFAFLWVLNTVTNALSQIQQDPSSGFHDAGTFVPYLSAATATLAAFTLAALVANFTITDIEGRNLSFSLPRFAVAYWGAMVAATVGVFINQFLVSGYNNTLLQALGIVGTNDCTGGVVDFQATNVPSGTTAEFCYFVTGLSGTLSDLKLRKGDTMTGATNDFSYNTNATASSGNWWLTASNAPNMALPLDTELNPEESYKVNFAIQDGSAFDEDGLADGIINDDQVLTFVPATTTTTAPGATTTSGGGSSSDSGCVMNPAAGFGLEWLLLCAVPFLRRRMA